MQWYYSRSAMIRTLACLECSYRTQLGFEIIIKAGWMSSAHGCPCEAEAGALDKFHDSCWHHFTVLPRKWSQGTTISAWDTVLQWLEPQARLKSSSLPQASSILPQHPQAAGTATCLPNSWKQTEGKCGSAPSDITPTQQLKNILITKIWYTIRHSPSFQSDDLTLFLFLMPGILFLMQNWLPFGAEHVPYYDIQKKSTLFILWLDKEIYWLIKMLIEIISIILIRSFLIISFNKHFELWNYFWYKWVT